MALGRVTQRMMNERSLGGLQANLGRMAKLQEQLSTGRVLNRPSDSPSDTSSAMRLRDGIAATRQFQRNAEDGRSWLTQIDSALEGATIAIGRTRELALTAANSGAVGGGAREALATEIDQIRAGLVATANTTHMGRPIFGGITAGSTAYDASGTYVGVPGEVNRTIADGMKVRVDVDGPSAFGTAGSSVFDHLTAVAAAIRSGDNTALRAGIADLVADGERVSTTRAQAGSTYNRIESALGAGVDTELRLRTSLSEVENADLAEVVVDLKMQEVAYQAALGATARVMQPSLMDFLR